MTNVVVFHRIETATFYADLSLTNPSQSSFHIQIRKKNQILNEI
ncbi:1360_t:CDS:2 [Paraglomus occultum]|uniref:1360_t:CDS:1 n=1 Tax=Paraglomus occultum TaxID=144539 RepID=A0A9N8ZF16_9GLOM|nr:1360_t:CDS:2 [Paraglomus occultum]